MFSAMYAASWIPKNNRLRSLVTTSQPRTFIKRSSLYRSTQIVNHNGDPYGAFLRDSSTLYNCEANGACCPACTIAWMVSSLGFSLVYFRTLRWLSMVWMTGFSMDLTPCLVNSLPQV